jgi:hypothetical protein
MSGVHGGASANGESTTNKDATSGYVGLTAFKINIKNALGTITSFFQNANTVARTYTFQNRDGTIADDTDLALKENVANKSTDTALGTSDTLYPTQRATKTYIDNSVAGLLNDRGNHDASGNTFPTTGGSGTAGAIRKGDSWYVSVAGTLGGVAVNIGDNFRAKQDTPGQTAGNWAVLEGNIGYVPERSIDAASSKTTPVDADYFGIINSAASNLLYKVSWANIKATLKTYFDTLYRPFTSGTFTATGGTITTDGAFTVHTFTSSGTLSVSGGGERDIEYLVIAGAGGGGASNGGGGGAGGVREGIMPGVKTNKFVVVGGGGVGGIWPGTPNGTAGNPSAFGDVVALGGAPGRGEGASQPAAGGSGGGGGGSTGTAGSLGTLGQGFDGGTGVSTNNTAGGGGGADGVGVAGNGTSGGNGGPGRSSSINGSATTRAGGGGGGANSGATSAGTGQAGGGNGGKGASAAPGSAATANTGSGGGGGGNGSNGGAGGSGIVILRYRT